MATILLNLAIALDPGVEAYNVQSTDYRDIGHDPLAMELHATLWNTS